MMECKSCNVEMEKVYSFDQDNNQTWYFKCPMCGFRTKPNPITFDENGRVITKKQEMKPKTDTKETNNKPFNKRKKNKKPFNKEKRK